MAISLASLKRQSVTLAPMLLIYGTAGMGKTSTALEAPDAVYLQIAPELPPQNMEATTFGELASFSDVMEGLQSLYEGEHDFKSVVIDSLTALEPLVWAETCKRNNWTNIEQPGYGKGYLAADDVWREFIAGCDALRRDRGVVVSMLALADAANHEEPGKQPYKRYELRLHKRGEGLLTQAVDAILFINTKVTIKETDSGFNRKTTHVEGGGTRWMFTDGRPAFVAKNRLNMPAEFILPKGKAWAEIAKHFAAAPAAAPEPAAVAAAA